MSPKTTPSAPTSSVPLAALRVLWGFGFVCT
jgi:hypothetical protein